MSNLWLNKNLPKKTHRAQDRFSSQKRIRTNMVNSEGFSPTLGCYNLINAYIECFSSASIFVIDFVVFLSNSIMFPLTTDWGDDFLQVHGCDVTGSQNIASRASSEHRKLTFVERLSFM